MTIIGLPEEDDEKVRIQQMATGIAIVLEEKDILNVYRMGRKMDKPWHIMCTFSSNTKKREFVAKKKLLNSAAEEK